MENDWNNDEKRQKQERLLREIRLEEAMVNIELAYQLAVSYRFLRQLRHRTNEPSEILWLDRELSDLERQLLDR